MEPVIMRLTLGLEEEIDNAVYGDHYQHSREFVTSGQPFVREGEDGEWIPVNDWRTSSMKLTPEIAKRLARHFIEIGRHMDTTADEKIEAAKQVLRQRRACLKTLLEKNPDHPDKKYYEGKMDGYEQGIDLLGESLVSIRCEL